MALRGALAVHAFGNLGTEQASCSYACASQSRILVRSRPPTLRTALCLRSTKHRHRFTVSAAEENRSEDGTDDRETTEADLQALETRMGLGRRARREGRVVEPQGRPAPAPKPKKFEDMNLAEQAWSLYIGEKGVLFWLNKLAYASIYAVIGGWIVFRFVGPALGWYELDAPLLPPDQALGL